MLTRTEAIVSGVGLGITKSRGVLSSLSESSDDEEDESEPDSLLDIDGAFDVGFTGRVRVTGSPFPSGLSEDSKFKPLDYSGLVPC